MPTAKAKYVGDGAGALIDDFSTGLKQRLRGFFRHEKTQPAGEEYSEEERERAADAFVAHVL